MTDPAAEPHGRARARGRRVGGVAATGLALAVAGTSLAATAAAFAYGADGGTDRFTATFDVRTADVETTSCRALGASGQKLEGRYRGAISIDGQAYRLDLGLEVLVDRSTGLGSAEGRWTATDTRTGGLVARGELVAVAGEDHLLDPPDPDLDPPDPDIALQGLLIGLLDPPDPDLPAARLIGPVSAQLTDGGLRLVGAVGDPAGVGDPSDGELLPAVLVAAEGC